MSTARTQPKAPAFSLRRLHYVPQPGANGGQLIGFQRLTHARKAAAGQTPAGTVGSWDRLRGRFVAHDGSTGHTQSSTGKGGAS